MFDIGPPVGITAAMPEHVRPPIPPAVEAALDAVRAFRARSPKGLVIDHDGKPLPLPPAWYTHEDIAELQAQIDCEQPWFVSFEATG
jgi:hypothetical protein